MPLSIDFLPFIMPLPLHKSPKILNLGSIIWFAFFGPANMVKKSRGIGKTSLACPATIALDSVLRGDLKVCIRKSFKWLRFSTIYHNDLIIIKVKLVLDRLIEPAVKALLMLLVGQPKSLQTLICPNFSLFSQNIRLKVVHVPVCSEFVDGTEDPRGDVAVETMMVVKVDGRETNHRTSNVSVDPRD